MSTDFSANLEPYSVAVVEIGAERPEGKHLNTFRGLREHVSANPVSGLVLFLSKRILNAIGEVRSRVFPTSVSVRTPHGRRSAMQ